jgi:CheY-like chemotaxis protein
MSASAVSSAVFRVLVVDDEAAQRRLVDRFIRAELRETGFTDFEIAFASNGDEGLEKYYQAIQENRPFNLVFSDHEMPGSSHSGKEFLDKILSHRESPFPMPTLGFRTSRPLEDFEADANFAEFRSKVYYIQKDPETNPQKIRGLTNQAYSAHRAQPRVSRAQAFSDPSTGSLLIPSRRSPPTSRAPSKTLEAPKKHNSKKAEAPSFSSGNFSNGNSSAFSDMGKAKTEDSSTIPAKEESSSYRVCCCWFSSSAKPSYKRHDHPKDDSEFGAGLVSQAIGAESL